MHSNPAGPIGPTPTPAASPSAEIELVQAGFFSHASRVILRDAAGWRGSLHLAPSASAELRALAADASRILTAMVNQPHDPIGVDHELRAPGIVLGTFAGFAQEALGFAGPTPEQLCEGPHEYVVLTAAERLWLLGKDARAAGFALYRVLEQLGYAQLLPTPRWEVIPCRERISVRMALGESSLLRFVHGLGVGGAVTDLTKQRVADWGLKNRLPTLDCTFGHAYRAIINSSTFEPQWHVSGSKLCVLEAGVKDAALAWVRQRLAENPQRVVQTLAAADGTRGWMDVCTGTDEQSTYTPSERQVLLANYVQGEIADSGVRLSILAYGATAPAPRSDAVPVDDRLVLCVTDGYFSGDYGWNAVIDEYRERGYKDFVAYQYTGVWPWSLGRPGHGPLFDMDRIERDVDRVLALPGSLKGLHADCGAAWGPWSLGLWVLAKLCTDRTTTTDARVWRQKFIDTAFGPRAASMSEFYSVMERVGPLSQDRIHRLYRCLRDALKQNPSSAIEQRIEDMAAYTVYLDLFLAWQHSDEVEAFDEMAAWMWRCRDLEILPVANSYQQPATWTPWFTRLLDIYGGDKFEFRTEKPTRGPWAKKDEPFGDDEIARMIEDGLARNALFPFQVVEYSEDMLDPRFSSDDRPRGDFDICNRDHTFYLSMRTGQTTWTVEHEGGRLDPTRNGSLKVFEMQGEEPIAQITVSGRAPGKSDVPLNENTIYRVEVDANGGIHWSCPGFATTTLTDLAQPIYVGSKPFSGYFLVPAGTTRLGGYASDGVKFRDPGGTQAFETQEEGYFAFEIASADLDEVWSFRGARGRFRTLTVPHGIAQTQHELLTPRELVLTDTGRPHSRTARTDLAPGAALQR